MISSSKSLIIAIPVLCLLAACASNARHSGLSEKGGSDVSMLEVSTSETISYSGSPGVSFNHPFPDPGNVLPQYPAEEIDRGVDSITLLVDVVVSEHGTVDRIQTVGPTDRETTAFLSSIERAVKTWRYTPLIRTEVSGRAPLSDEKAGQVVSVSLPFTQRYAFTFSRIDGKPAVSAAANSND